ncbi:MAG: hypothetical protein A2599_01570 [Candidatus Staskawiczbacteria bacterium RIFOXYD1_FULL_39_28]|uniref:Uncharacterized protein n=1 Tax=Candidatus Staskawiczbacteria bacterium RIFOXYC1_FULL_38_18 TaxID=1802229 RepID=A0A1G2J985_9BACT|nr:MAG: hypothetical protein A2401_00315 [Candidatus Staskawiczbacteria bacterium RIFOXYC1_FULL_38_18]OGZ92007.1 MAG: hypothetical protein A2599_01570 [Candidatus Staskawiczbacteria bacterium RIFOXYD1_FULL_39_28]
MPRDAVEGASEHNDDLSDNSQQTNSEPKTRQERLNELMSSYSSLRNIPKSELEKIGYVKIVYEGGVKLAMKEKLEEAEQAEKEKAERAPFGVIKIEGKTTSVGRRISEGDLGAIDEKIADYIAGDYWIDDDNISELYGANSPVVFLCKKLLEDENLAGKICQRFGIEEDDYTHKYFISNIFTTAGIASATAEARTFLGEEWDKIYLPAKDFFYVLRTGDPEEVDEFENGIMEDVDGEEKLPGAKSEEISNKLENLRGKLADQNFYAGEFSKSLYSVNHYAYAEFGLKGREDATTFEISKFVFSQILGSYDGMNQIAQTVELAKTREELIAELGKINITKTEEEKSITGQMKGASVEKKKELSGRLKELREQREEKSKILSGIREYYGLPKTAAEGFSRVIKEAQAKLTKGSNEKEEEFSLDARPNKKLDKNPGRVSGDCTEDSPLPFHKTDIPLYNVKVLREKNHIGNVYLLETESEDGQPVWHLDAIQIPVNLKWSEFIDDFFASLGGAASKKKVSGITVSVNENHVSNYDYIREAVGKHCKKIKAKNKRIKIPNFDHLGEGYSRLQSDGEVFFIPASEN